MTALVAAGALLAVACGDDDTVADRAGAAGDGEVTTGVGVTDDPCPDTGHPDRACIYLGTLSDLTTGPFAALAGPAIAAQEAFWARVNDQGGIGGAYDVDVTSYVRDNQYNPETHVARYQEIEPKVLALSQSLGTPMTIAALPLYERDGIVAAPASWWSGWEFEDRILESGSNFCVEAMNGVDYAVETYQAKTAMIVHFPGDYGGDYANGVELAAAARGLTILERIETGPKSVVGSQEAPIDAIVRQQPDLVFVAVSPGDMAEIVGGAATRGFTGHFIGLGPNWNPSLADTPAGPALEAQFVATYPTPPYGADTPGHRAMREALGDVKSLNDAFTWWWVWQYPLKAVLEEAYERGVLTRPGLEQVASELETVDYEGMLPPEAGRFAGTPDEVTFRQNLVVKPDRSAPTGVSVVRDFFAGPTATAHRFTEPCQAVS